MVDIPTSGLSEHYAIGLKEKVMSSKSHKADRCPKVAKKLLPSVSSEQLDTLLDATDSLRDRAMVALLFDSGLGLSELAGIRSKDTDWSNNTLRVVAKGNREARAAFNSNTAMLLKNICPITVTTRRSSGCSLDVCKRCSVGYQAR
jgi:site-specific recombinase XerC